MARAQRDASVEGRSLTTAIETTGFRERRDLGARRRRDTVAEWFELHPRQLATLPEEVLETMLDRIEHERSLEYEVRELQAAAHHWQELARTDQLTGLPNRRAVEERLAVELERSQRYSRPLAVLLADVDHLKRVNDRHGHEAGDTLLRETARRLSRAVRRVDMVARWAGDEFVVVCPEADADAAARIAGKLVDLSAARLRIPGAVLDCGLSVGWAIATDEDTAVEAVRAADAALYRAKAAGRGRHSA